MDEAEGRSRTAARTVRSTAAGTGTKREVMARSAQGRWPNEPLHVTAARERFLLNPHGHGWAAALERERSADRAERKQ